jgi:hypothetical protein
MRFGGASSGSGSLLIDYVEILNYVALTAVFSGIMHRVLGNSIFRNLLRGRLKNNIDKIHTPLEHLFIPV